MTSKLIDIPPNASPEGRMIMQAMNQFFCLLDERFRYVVTKSECAEQRQAMREEQQEIRERESGQGRSTLALVFAGLSLVGTLGGFMWAMFVR